MPVTRAQAASSREPDNSGSEPFIPIPDPSPALSTRTDQQSVPPAHTESPPEPPSTPTPRRATPVPDHVQQILDIIRANNEDLQRRQGMDTVSLIQTLLEHQPKSEPKIDVNRPEVFTGKNSKKLRPFLFACNLTFESNSRAYDTDEKKINFAVALFSETALLWAQTQFARNPRPAFLSNWQAFVTELRTLFGEPDATHRAAMELEKLQMKNEHRAARYVTEFFSITAELAWNDEALEHAFYRRLAPRILTQLALVGRRRGLAALRAQILELDSHHWEFNTDKPTQPTPAPKAQSTSDRNSGTSRQSSPAPRQQNNRGSSSNNSSSSRTANPSYAKYLTPEGRLTPEELKRRIDENLCRYCAKPGHQYADCRNRPNQSKSPQATPAPKAKARAATTESTASISEVTETSEN